VSTQTSARTTLEERDYEQHAEQEVHSTKCELTGGDATLSAKNEQRRNEH
jgi:hypothetical protein